MKTHGTACIKTIKTFSALAIACSLGLGVALPATAQTLDCKGCVRSKQLKNNGVRSKDIKDGQVKAKDLAAGAVTGDKIKGGAVTADKLSLDALAGGRQPVADCGTIDQPGSYVLVNDLPGPLGLNADGGCLMIEADDVTLDLAGFSIVGDGTGDPDRGDGIAMDGRSNVTIRNGTIRDFVDDGIHERNSQARNHRVDSIRVLGNGVPDSGNGISLVGTGHQVTNCLAVGNGRIGILADKDALVTGSEASANADIGIWVGSGATVIGNSVNGNEGGISAGSLSTISGNAANENDQKGIFAGVGSTVSGNTANLNGGDGIGTISDSSVTGNRAANNSGFAIAAGSLSVVVGNVATDNDTNIEICLACEFAGNIPAVP